MVGDEVGAAGMSIDDCVQHVADECFLRLSVQISADVVLANFAHVCPHVLAPSIASACIGILSRRMDDVVGGAGAKFLRSSLAREFVRLPGPPVDMSVSGLLQELLSLDLCSWVGPPHFLWDVINEFEMCCLLISAFDIVVSVVCTSKFVVCAKYHSSTNSPCMIYVGAHRELNCRLVVFPDSSNIV
jgi:hypothetical protein